MTTGRYMRGVTGRLEDLEVGHARQEEIKAWRAKPMGCPAGLSPSEIVDWWEQIPSSQQRQIELRAMKNEQFYPFVDAMVKKHPELARLLKRSTPVVNENAT